MQLRQAAEALGVHYQTAYAWVRQGVLPARKIGRGYEVDDQAVARFAAQRARGSEPSRQIRVRDWSGLADRFFEALRDGAETRARTELARFDRAVSLIDLCENVIAPALRRIGSEWLAGRLSIAHEHRASAICERLIALHAGQPSGRPRGVAIVATPPGERHSLPALMAAACLREDHWLVHHLATDLPMPEVLRLSADTDADLIVMSTSSDVAARQVYEEFEAAAAPDWVAGSLSADGAGPQGPHMSGPQSPRMSGPTSGKGTTTGPDGTSPNGTNPDVLSGPARPRLLIGTPGQTLRDLVLMARDKTAAGPMPGEQAMAAASLRDQAPESLAAATQTPGGSQDNPQRTEQ